MQSKLFSSLWVVALGLLVAGSPGWAADSHVISVEAAQGLAARRGAEIEIPLKLMIRTGYHINSNTPAEDYLIPTVLSWTPNPLPVRKVIYPKAETVRYDFTSKPLLVYSGTITVVSRFAVPADAPRGAATLAGKLRYQACTDKMCLPPRTLDVTVPVTVE